VYGGAGVHVTYLARELAPLVDLTVHCEAWTADAVAHRPGTPRRRQPGAPVMSTTCHGRRRRTAQLVHSHTWYANMAGHLAAMLYGIPHVVTMHS